ncbi:MAG: hypothetical protein RLZ56_635 [Bacteroidota bacterium]|jgi:CarboxypepD_reg-like domain
MVRFVMLALLLSGISNIVDAQDKIAKGRIIDAETKQVIPYVNIGIFQKNIGTVSNENGQYQLRFSGNYAASDSIIFSHVGYRTVKYPIAQLLNPMSDIQLSPVSNTLQEVVVKSRKLTEKILGRNGKGLGLMHYNFYTFYEKEVDDRLGKEAGILLKNKRDCFLNELQMQISSNEFASLKFRLNFYKIVDGIPTELILPKEIVFEIRDGFVGLYKFDLKPFTIYLTKDLGDVAATIQWVESKKTNPNSKYFSLYSSLSTNSSFVSRPKSMASWEKSKQDVSISFLSECD